MAQVLARVLEDGKAPQQHLVGLRFWNLEEECPSLRDEHAQESGGPLAGLIGALDVFPLRSKVSSSGPVEPVRTHVPVKVRSQGVAFVAEEEDVLAAVRCSMADPYAAQGFEHMRACAPGLGQVPAEDVVVDARLGNCPGPDHSWHVSARHEAVFDIGMA